MTKFVFLPLCFLPLAACGPKVEPICPDHVYNKYGYTQDNCRDNHRGAWVIVPFTFAAPENPTEPRGEGEGGDRVHRPMPKPDRPSSEPPSVSQPDPQPNPTPEEPTDEPKEDPAPEQPPEEPPVDRPKPYHSGPSDGGDKSPHEDKTRPHKDHPKKSKAQGHK